MSTTISAAKDQHSDTMTPTTNLMTLPPELRLIIYEHLINDTTIKEPYFNRCTAPSMPPIMRTCHLARLETAKLYVKQLSKIGLHLRDDVDLAWKDVLEARRSNHYRRNVVEPRLPVARRRYCEFNEKKDKLVRKFRAEYIEV